MHVREVCEWKRGGLGNAVSSHGAVGHAWTLGLVRRPVVLSGMRRWPSEALHGCCVENGFIMETLSGAYSQGSQELSAPAGAC